MGSVRVVEAEDEPSDQLDAAMRSIGQHARTVNLGRAARLADALETVGAGRLDDRGRRAATEVAHQLVGSAGTFGFAGASDLAGELEQFFTDGAFDDPRRLGAARSTLHRLQQVLREPTPDPAGEV